MVELKKEEMQNINGGAVNWAAIAGISALLSFMAGVVDGYVNPLKCRNR